MDRRKAIAGMAAGAAVVTGAALSLPGDPSSQATPTGECALPARGPFADYFPNVALYTHEGRRALFYDDLLRGKTVMINCMSVAHDAVYPTTSNLRKVQQLLGDRLGRDVFMYSLSVDPENDTPEVLRAFVEQQEIGPGWLFLTGTLDDVYQVHSRLFARSGGHVHGVEPMRDCSLGLVRYGNEAVGIWGRVPAKAEPAWIAQRLAWIQPRQQPAGVFRRKGPMVAENPWLQQKDPHA